MCKYNYGATSNVEALKIWKGAPLANTNTPIFRDGYIYVTSGYNHVGAKYKISKDLDSLSLVWVDTILDVHHGGVVLVGNYIYGANWIENSPGKWSGKWCCIDWETGKEIYQEVWQTKGSIIYSDSMLYCYDERWGNIALVDANPKGFNIKGSFKVPYGKGPHWAHPVIKNGVLYIRHENAIMAYDIRKH
ncbi:MAG: hypothetical protein H8E98_06995 [Bacteroidetes bacterium]|nr:hypothetical protein [Bacteroidota bacterium]